MVSTRKSSANTYVSYTHIRVYANHFQQKPTVVVWQSLC